MGVDSVEWFAKSTIGQSVKSLVPSAGSRARGYERQRVLTASQAQRRKESERYPAGREAKWASLACSRPKAVAKVSSAN
jgi:hypothetical protein